jgi:hypothetical protein
VWAAVEQGKVLPINVEDADRTAVYFHNLLATNWNFVNCCHNVFTHYLAC